MQSRRVEGWEGGSPIPLDRHPSYLQPQARGKRCPTPAPRPSPRSSSATRRPCSCAPRPPIPTPQPPHCHDKLPAPPEMASGVPSQNIGRWGALPHGFRRFFILEYIQSFGRVFLGRGSHGVFGLNWLNAPRQHSAFSDLSLCLTHKRAKDLKKSPRPQKQNLAKTPKTIVLTEANPKARAKSEHASDGVCQNGAEERDTGDKTPQETCTFFISLFRAFCIFFDTHRVSKWIQGQPAEAFDVNI